MHKFDASVVDVTDGDESADDSLDAFGFSTVQLTTVGGSTCKGSAGTAADAPLHTSGFYS